MLGSRLLSGALGIPAFFTEGVPAWGQAIAAAGLVLAVVSAALLLPTWRSRATA